MVGTYNCGKPYIKYSVAFYNKRWNSSKGLKMITWSHSVLFLSYRHSNIHSIRHHGSLLTTDDEAKQT